MSCNEFKRHLALLVGQDLEECEAGPANRHTAECPACRETLRQLEDVQTAVCAASEFPQEIDGESLWPRIRARLAPASVELPKQNFPSWLPTATLAAACLALLIFVGSTPMLRVQDEPDSYADDSFNSLSNHSEIQSFPEIIDLNTKAVDFGLRRENFPKPRPRFRPPQQQFDRHSPRLHRIDEL